MEVSRHWRLRGQRYSLTGTTCPHCGKQFFAPRPVCDACSAPAVEVYSFANGRSQQQAVPLYEPAQS